MMTAKEVRGLPVAKKVHLMEMLWEDLLERFEQTKIPEEHRKLLDKRRSQVESGEKKLLEWDAVKASIGRPSSTGIRKDST